jgi:excisionase family DNA binding protein
MNGNDFGDRLVSAETGGLEIGVKADTLRRWARDGHLPSFKVRGALRFRLSDLKALIVPRLADKQKVRRG